jgi:hypothetical protein
MNNGIDGYFTDDQLLELIIVTKVISGISILSSFAIFYIYWKYREIRNFSHEIIVWYSVSTSLYAATSFIPYDGKTIDISCGIQSYTLTWFQNASLAWCCIIGYSSFINVIKKTHLENNRMRYRIIFLVISFVITGLISSMYILLT